VVVARHINSSREYDPSLPSVLANRDQLIQVFLNLVKKNAAEAIGENAADGEIQLSHARFDQACASRFRAARHAYRCPSNSA